MINLLHVRVSGKLAADFLGIAVHAMKEAKEMDDTPWGHNRNHALMEAAVQHECAANAFQLAIDALRILTGDSEYKVQDVKPPSETEVVSGPIV
jgi:hypothetical protein